MEVDDVFVDEVVYFGGVVGCEEVVEFEFGLVV